MLHKTVLIFIATGDRYQKYVRPVIDGANRFFPPHDTLLFTDRNQDIAGVDQVMIRPRGYPGETLYRYHTILLAEKYLELHEHVFYSDIDMEFVGQIGQEIFSDGITATLHPGHIQDAVKPVETNPYSTACAIGAKNYYCGGFNGGTRQSFLAMAQTIARNVDDDADTGIVAKWHDESHLNKYLMDNPPAKVLSPSYCYPSNEQRAWFIEKWGGQDYERKIVCIDKE